MSELEYVDIFNENLEQVGVATRAEAHAQGYWHQTVHCWLIRRERNAAYVLFQRRGPDKLLFPNLLDITAAGHLLHGETPADAVRELNEELGLAVDSTELVPLGIKHDCALVGAVVNREFAHVYLLERNTPLEDYKLQADEVTGLVQMELRDGLQLFSGEVDAVPVSGFAVDAQGQKRPIVVHVSRPDFVPCVDNYYLKLCIMVERYIQGNRYLAI